MNYSLNEVEALAKKAVRGAGYPWGVAEDAGKAIRLLSAHTLPGCDALAALLERIDRSSDFSQLTPNPQMDTWSGRMGTLCPILTGITLSDFHAELHHRTITLQNVYSPLIVTAFAALASQQLARNVTAIWPSTEFVTDGEQCSTTGDWRALVTENAQSLTIGAGGDLAKVNERTTRPAVGSSSWQTLNKFAHRTYAPDTETSRTLGAGPD